LKGDFLLKSIFFNWYKNFYMHGMLQLWLH